MERQNINDCKLTCESGNWFTSTPLKRGKVRCGEGTPIYCLEDIYLQPTSAQFFHNNKNEVVKIYSESEMVGRFKGLKALFRVVDTKGKKWHSKVKEESEKDPYNKDSSEKSEVYYFCASTYLPYLNGKYLPLLEGMKFKNCEGKVFLAFLYLYKWDASERGQYHRLDHDAKNRQYLTFWIFEGEEKRGVM